MGGDGGVIPKNRRYLRGAGAGDKTGDSNNAEDRKAVVDPNVLKEELARSMRTCAISNRPLSLASFGEIVVCPYGRLYAREAVVEALLERKKTKDPRLDHIRGLKDLHDVRFHLSRSSSAGRAEEGGDDQVPSCPIRGTELNGLIPALVLLPGSSEVPNVVSERAVKEMGTDAIHTEYGPTEQSIKLLPYGEELEAIKVQHETIMAESKKNRKKRTRESLDSAITDSWSNKLPKSSEAPTSTKTSRSKVLESLFNKQPTKLAENEKAENLFARCG